IGSATRVVARETGAWVYGFEPDAMLVEAADRISTQAGLAKKAAVESTLFEKSDIRDASRDAVLSFEALYTVEDKEALLATIKRFLKPRGQLLITDFARAIEQESSPDIEIWSAYERQPVHLAAADWYASHLGSLGFDVRVVEDMSAAYCREIVQTLYAFSNSMTDAPVSEAFKPWILWEVEC
ncbi:MAG: methyltransferase domain-containing protein, partial [Alphaproteobacteria bacterium]|nr:methyltransferase domain-containing protein [Alphaproteobacteria bacterium]